jgi:hypothetical protein
MERLAGTVSTWWPQLLAAITTGVTNAASEGINRLIKTDARAPSATATPPTSDFEPVAPPPAEPEDTSPAIPAADKTSPDAQNTYVTTKFDEPAFSSSRRRLRWWCR